MTSTELQAAVGAEFWVPGEYDKALALARGDGMIVQGPRDRYTAV